MKNNDDISLVKKTLSGDKSRDPAPHGRCRDRYYIDTSTGGGKRVRNRFHHLRNYIREGRQIFNLTENPLDRFVVDGHLIPIRGNFSSQSIVPGVEGPLCFPYSSKPKKTLTFRADQILNSQTEFSHALETDRAVEAALPVSPGYLEPV